MARKSYNEKSQGPDGLPSIEILDATQADRHVGSRIPIAAPMQGELNPQYPDAIEGPDPARS